MFEYIKGQIVDLYDDKVIIECSGIGYAVFVSLNTLSDLQADGGGTQTTQLYIYEYIKEDEFTFYGFLHKNERKVFVDLISVSGIGPKVAMGIMSKFRERELIKYIISEDEKALSSAPGIGKKTANRMILELKDKFSKIAIEGDIGEEIDVASRKSGIQEDAVEALISLGYDYHQSAHLVGRAYKENMSIEELIKGALSIKEV